MLGLDISDRSIKAVELTDSEPRRLLTACWAPVPAALMRRGVVQDVDALLGALEQALKRCSPRPPGQRTVVASIPEVQSYARVLEVPAMTEAEMDEAVRWAARQHLPFDLERVYMDWQPLATPARTARLKQVLIGAAKREVVDPLLQVLDGLELNVVALELEAQAIVRSLLPRDNVTVSGVLLVDLGATSTNVIYFDQGALRFTTSVARGGDDLTEHLVNALHLQPSIAAEKKVLVGVAPTTQESEVAATLHEVTSSLVRQIALSANEMLSPLGPDVAVREVLLAGGGANLPGLVGVFGEVFPNIPVQLGNPWINLEVEGGTDSTPPLSAADAGHFATAIGLALREAR